MKERTTNETTMTIGKILDIIILESERAIRNPNINKPISYALYQTFKWCNEREQNRNEKEVTK